MFIRCRTRNNNLLVYVLTGDRIDGKVRQRHVAYLGALYIPPTTPPARGEHRLNYSPLRLLQMRDSIWAKLRLTITSNKIDSRAAAKLRQQLEAHVPKPLASERTRLERQEAREEAAFKKELARLARG